MNHIRDTNPLLESIRRAYQNSPMYARLHGLPEPVKTVQREPGEDLPLGVAIDPLEQEFADRSNP